MKEPWLEEEKYCDECGALMENIDQFEWECPKCGVTLNTEPDWDSMFHGKDYE